MGVLQDFDLGKLLPETEKFYSSLAGWVRFFVLLVPLVLLGIGLWHRYYPPKSSDSGIRLPAFVKLDSRKAAQLAQKLAGKVYLLLGGALTAVMFVISLFFSGKHALATAIVALICVILEFLLVIWVWVLIARVARRTYPE